VGFGVGAQLLAALNEVRSPVRSAHLFSIEEIVDPRDTRPLACEWATLAYAKMATDGPRPAAPTFRP
jgi:hypothetical protein